MAEMKSQQFIDFVLDIFKAQSIDLELKERDFQTFRSRFLNEGVSFITKTLPLLGKALDVALSTGRFICPTNFKRQSTRSALPAFLGSLFGRIFTSKGVLRSDADPLSVSIIRQISFFFNKLDLPYKEEENQAVVANFLSTENELAKLDFEFDPILKVGSILIQSVLSDYSSDRIRPKHGPGATSNYSGSNKHEKVLDPLSSVENFGMYHFFNSNDGMDRISRYPTRSHENYFHDKNNCARVILVPKDSRGPRLISCEPVENQYIQQGIMAEMVDQIESHPYTKGRVNFTDQTVNRNLALQASKDQSFSTLDLKEASDRISIRLVNFLFSGVPELLSDLMLSRSRYTRLPNDDIVELLKFAPMGSACCFPVMALCVWTIIVSYIFGRCGSIHRSMESVYVYGDDIIVATEYAADITSLLARYGLVVNTQKSFINSRFCESCGCDAFDGIDVTPVRFRKLWDFSHPFTSRNPQAFISFVELGNSLYRNGMIPASKVVFRYLSKVVKLPKGKRTSPYLHQEEIFPSRILDSVKNQKKRKPKIKDSPLGFDFLGLTSSPVKVSEETTGFGHLSRIYGMLGRDLIIPSFGEFSQPRRIKIKSSYFNHYDIS